MIERKNHARQCFPHVTMAKTGNPTLYAGPPDPCRARLKRVSSHQHFADRLGQLVRDKLGNVRIGADTFHMPFIGGAGEG